jgi:hypothetical protein
MEIGALAMSTRSIMTGFTTLRSPEDSSSFDVESIVLARWLELGDAALAIMPSPKCDKRPYQIRHTQVRSVHR